MLQRSFAHQLITNVNTIIDMIQNVHVPQMKQLTIVTNALPDKLKCMLAYVISTLATNYSCDCFYVRATFSSYLTIYWSCNCSFWKFIE